MSRSKLAAAIVSVALLTGACGDGESTAEGGNVATEDVAAAAAYLADLFDLGADVVEAQTRPEVAADPALQAEFFEDFVGDLEALAPPPELRDLHETTLDIWRSLATATREFSDAVAGGDVQETQAAAIEFLEFFEEHGRRIGETDADQAVRARELLLTRTDQASVYAAELLRLVSESAPMVETMFASLGSLATDPDAALEQMAEVLEPFQQLNEQWKALDPPPEYLEMHRGLIDLNDGFTVSFGELVDAAQRGVQPSPSSLLEFQRLAAEAPALNAERSRFFAEVLRALGG